MPHLITRADDFGSSLSANAAILEGANGSYIRNISCMAAGPAIEQGACELRNLSGCCLGMHAVLNSEWDRIKWRPCSDPDQIRSLLTSSGQFPPETAYFIQHPPDLDEVLFEFDRQLDRLTLLRLPIRYVDMHMMPYAEIPALQEAMSAWIRQKGLIDHIGFYRTPAQFEPAAATDMEQAQRSWSDWLDLLTDGTYFNVMHPCKMSLESLLMGSRGMPGKLVAQRRDTEYRLLASGTLERLCAEKGIVTVRYDEVMT